MILIRSFLLLFAVIFSLSAKSNETEFNIATTLQSNMVVQRGAPLVIWGTASCGSKTYCEDRLVQEPTGYSN